ncbi:hypothetical protein ARMGADRAFT_149916 [Armillaria gallica]|uniref:Uncharacterized protein n=1 Tax=Armillaria gallica TaxID=47427 RepID=A0A2H3DQL3_ARMGA|nr:hypothetical protein ARMGADRAFT_149916 [Armillaria gallica]
MHLSASVSLLLVYFRDADALCVVGLAASDGDIFDRTEAQRLKHVCLHLEVSILIELAMCCWCLYLACDYRFESAHSNLIAPPSELGWRVDDLTDEQLRQRLQAEAPTACHQTKMDETRSHVFALTGKLV